MTPTDLETLRGLVLRRKLHIGAVISADGYKALTALLADYERIKQDAEALLAACEQEFTSEATENKYKPSYCKDSESVMANTESESPITFGMLRKLRATLSEGERG